MKRAGLSWVESSSALIQAGSSEFGTNGLRPDALDEGRSSK